MHAVLRAGALAVGAEGFPHKSLVDIMPTRFRITQLEGGYAAKMQPNHPLEIRRHFAA